MGGEREKGKRGSWYIAGILAKPICLVSRSVGDNVSSFPFCQIFTVNHTVSIPPQQSPEWRTKDERREEMETSRGL